MRGKLKLMPILGAMVIGTVLALLISTFHHPGHDVLKEDGSLKFVDQP